MNGEASTGPLRWFPFENPAGDYRHQVFLYRGLDEYLDVVGAFVRTGLEAGERVHVAAPGELGAHLRAVLPGTGTTLTYADPEGVGDNPARLLAPWRQFLDEADATQCRGVGGSVRHGLDGAQLDECQRHERILNVAFTGDPFLLLCPYDATALGEDTLDLARESHPLVLESGRSRISDAYQPDQLLDSLFIGPLTAPTGAVTERRFDRYGLAGLRRFVADRAVAGGAGDRCDDLVLATSEIATNIVTHGGDEGEVRCWTDGDWMVCELEGSGTITDPLAGRLRPDPAQPGGRGLWLANQLCDLVQVRNTGMGSVVRLRVRSSTGPA